MGNPLFQADTSSTVLAKPVPHTGIPFQPKLPHQHTVPEPFTVEERSKMMLAQKEEKIKQILEEERRVSASVYTSFSAYGRLESGIP